MLRLRRGECVQRSLYHPNFYSDFLTTFGLEASNSAGLWKEWVLGKACLPRWLALACHLVPHPVVVEEQVAQQEALCLPLPPSCHRVLFDTLQRCSFVTLQHCRSVIIAQETGGWVPTRKMFMTKWNGCSSVTHRYATLLLIKA